MVSAEGNCISGLMDVSLLMIFWDRVLNATFLWKLLYSQYNNQISKYLLII